MKKKIYIAGCGGMLGAAFYQVFKNDYQLTCTDKDVNEPWLGFCDFRNKEDYRKSVLAASPNYLFHLGALTSLEYCEDNPEDAYRTNTLAVEYAVQIANELKIPLLYISTAGIFDGNKALYDDWDVPNPLGHYARSKFLGEQFVQQHAHQYLICRAGWMMGGGPAKDKKFVKKILAQLANGAKELHIVDDKDGTPTYTVDFARNVKHLIEQDTWGLFNLVCGGQTSRVEVAQEILRHFNLEKEVALIPVQSDYFKATYY
ncbi:MAG TPA: sugar nucleotide-binding protein, partial [Phnomibacter sp.]|nr:sugar nucleotide-binding protein [Phnomibacter sp.]